MTVECEICGFEIVDAADDCHIRLCESCTCIRCGERPSVGGRANADYCVECIREETYCERCNESYFEEDLNEFAGDLLCDDCYDALSPLERLAECAE